MKSITLKLTIQYEKIAEVRKTSNKKTIIIFKSGDKLTLNNGQAKRVFKQLQRNFPGEQLD